MPQSLQRILPRILPLSHRAKGSSTQPITYQLRYIPNSMRCLFGARVIQEDQHIPGNAPRAGYDEEVCHNSTNEQNRPKVSTGSHSNGTQQEGSHNQRLLGCNMEAIPEEGK